MRRQFIVFILVFTIKLAATYGLLASRTYAVIDGVIGLRLVGGSKLYYFTQSLKAWVQVR